MFKSESSDAKKLHDQRQFSYDRIAEYRSQFIDPESGLHKECYLRKRVCPVCGSENHATVFVKSGGTTVKCLDCSMIFLNPVFTDQALEEYYTNLNTGQAQIVEGESDFYREIYLSGLALIEKYVAAGSIFDIGCSSGFFLELCKERDWKASGLELGREEAALAVAKGFNITTVPVEKMDSGSRFNAITLWDVFEHICDGAQFVQTLKNLLEPKGVIFLQIPNAESLAARVMREDCNMHDCLEHVNLYGPSTIKQLLNSNGFQILEMRTVISELAVVNNYVNYEDPYTGKVPFEGSVLGVFNDQTIHEQLLGYKMQLVFQVG
ncbi:class I SAM-dependent methyltransferase [Oligoflexia bacterium]|nr:class I SAM-dependent methyltransferase [Oligoflexia bacterium]